MKKSLDVVILFALLLARVMLNKFAEAGLFQHFENVTTSPTLSKLLPSGVSEVFGPWYGDPIFLLLTSLGLLAFLVYVVLDLYKDTLSEKIVNDGKYLLLWIIILTVVILPAAKMIILRHENLPQSYSHDGGVIQTEVAIDYFLQGKSPYIETYHNTPMADWGFAQFRTALDHYPYLPATFILSAPIKTLALHLWGWYDQRFTYLLLFILMLFLLRGITGHNHEAMLGLTMFVGLNPLMGLDVIFGQNDVFVLAWLIVSAWFLARKQWLRSSIFFGIAVASKPTAWFLAPFWALALLEQENLSLKQLLQKITLKKLVQRTSPAIAIFLLLTLPYFIWSPDAFIDDVWRWAAGTAQTHYQIWGMGFSNFVLLWGGLPDRFAYWPFWIPEIIISLPLIIVLLTRQFRDNTISSWFWHGAILLLGFSYFSRFLNENYLGFILSLLAVGYYAQAQENR